MMGTVAPTLSLSHKDLTRPATYMIVKLIGSVRVAVPQLADPTEFIYNPFLVLQNLKNKNTSRAKR